MLCAKEVNLIQIILLRVGYYYRHSFESTIDRDLQKWKLVQRNDVLYQPRRSISQWNDRRSLADSDRLDPQRLDLDHSAGNHVDQLCQGFHLRGNFRFLEFLIKTWNM